MKVSRILPLILPLVALGLPACNAHREQRPDLTPKITVAPVESKPVTLTQQYVAQIQSHHRIDVRAPEAGYLEAIPIQAGQLVKQGDVLFQLRRTLGKQKRDHENTEPVLSIAAPFDGMAGRLPHQQGSMVKSGETLTTLSDSSVMWVYFKIPEARYLEYHAANLEQHKDELKIELVLADGKKFDQPGTLGAIGATFDSATGRVRFRADFPNPDGLLRDGQTGTVMVSQAQEEALIIPQRATVEVLGKRYVYVVDKNSVAHQREVVVRNELDDHFVIKQGAVGVDDKIVVEGIRRVRDGEQVACDDRQAKKVVANFKPAVQQTRSFSRGNP